MFRLTDDLMKSLIEKHPEINIRRIVHDIFDAILEKSLKDGSCKINEFGKFNSFKTYSTKLSTEVIRFKFKISPVLENKIKFDQYLLNNSPVKAKVPFTEEHLEKCNQEVKKANVNAALEATRVSNEKTKDREMSQLVQEILNS